MVSIVPIERKTHSKKMRKRAPANWICVDRVSSRTILYLKISRFLIRVIVLFFFICCIEKWLINYQLGKVSRNSPRWQSTITNKIFGSQIRYVHFHRLLRFHCRPLEVCWTNSTTQLLAIRANMKSKSNSLNFKMIYAHGHSVCIIWAIRQMEISFSGFSTHQQLKLQLYGNGSISIKMIGVTWENRFGITMLIWMWPPSLEYNVKNSHS